MSDLDERAMAKGWPEGLLDRMRAVKTPSWQLEQWVGMEPQKPDLFFADLERHTAVFERLGDAKLRAREVTYRDEESFSALWAASPEMIGDWEIRVERGPDALAQFRLQDDTSVTVLEDDGEIVACTAWSTTNVLVAGRPVSIHWAMALRVHGGRRRSGFGDIVRRFPRRALQRPTLAQAMTMRTGNDGVDNFLKTVGFQAANERPQKPVVTHHYTAVATGPAEGVRPATRDDAEACAALINRTHAGLDLFAPETGWSLALKLDEGVWGAKPSWTQRVYGWPEYRVLERNGKVVACAGLWDRGRDVRERWTNRNTGEVRTYAGTALLDFGCAEGCDSDLAALIRQLVGESQALGRTGLAVPLGQAPAVAAALADLDVREEVRTLEWSPFGPSVAQELDEIHIDLRYW
jgi:hypothetical protein